MPTIERTTVPVVVCGWQRELVDALLRRTTHLHLVLDRRDASMARHPSTGAGRLTRARSVHVLDAYDDHAALVAIAGELRRAGHERPAVLATAPRASDAVRGLDAALRGCHVNGEPPVVDERFADGRVLQVDAVSAGRRPRAFVVHTPAGDGTRVLPAAAHPTLYRRLQARLSGRVTDGASSTRVVERADGELVVTRHEYGLSGAGALLLGAYLGTDAWETLAAVATGQGYRAPRPLGGVVGLVHLASDDDRAVDVWTLAGLPGVSAWHAGAAVDVVINAPDEATYDRYRDAVVDHHRATGRPTITAASRSAA